MGKMLLMSKKEINRLGVIRDVGNKRMTQKEAGRQLNLSSRQVRRLLKRYKKEGVEGLISQKRGMASNNKISELRKEKILSLIKERYYDFGPTLATEKLDELHDIRISKETVEEWKQKKPDWEIKHYLQMFGLDGVKKQLIINYSHGMRQKLSLAAALLGQPTYIFLDEALNGLDSLALYHLKNHLKELAEEKKPIVISSHVIQLVVQWCDPVILMHEGKIIQTYSQQDISALEKKRNKTFETIYVETLTDLSQGPS